MPALGPARGESDREPGPTPETKLDAVIAQKSNCTLTFANRAVTSVVGTRQPVAVALL